MLCQRCKKNPAVVNYYETVNGNKYESHLCAFCYQDLFGELNDKSDNEKWSDLFGQESCPVCGTTFSDYKRTGLLGCAVCYDVFKEELLPFIYKIHGRTEHVGKVGTKNTDFGLRRQMNALQEQLEEAIREKKFREADRLNREINKIKKVLHGGGSNG